MNPYHLNFEFRFLSKVRLARCWAIVQTTVMIFFGSSILISEGSTLLCDAWVKQRCQGTLSLQGGQKSLQCSKGNLPHLQSRWTKQVPGQEVKMQLIDSTAYSLFPHPDCSNDSVPVFYSGKFFTKQFLCLCPSLEWEWLVYIGNT